MRILSNAFALYRWKGIKAAIAYYCYCLNRQLERQYVTCCIFFRELQHFANEE